MGNLSSMTLDAWSCTLQASCSPLLKTPLAFNLTFLKLWKCVWSLVRHWIIDSICNPMIFLCTLMLVCISRENWKTKLNITYVIIQHHLNVHWCTGASSNIKILYVLNQSSWHAERQIICSLWSRNGISKCLILKRTLTLWTLWWTHLTAKKQGHVQLVIYSQEDKSWPLAVWPLAVSQVPPVISWQIWQAQQNLHLLTAKTYLDAPREAVINMTGQIGQMHVMML